MTLLRLFSSLPRLAWFRGSLAAALLAVASASALAAAGRAEWFTEARFGMFIHWSPGGIYGAHWHGEPFRGPGAYGEWTRARNRVSRADYDAALPLLNASPAQIEEWVLLAREAGMKYIVFVAKHHDGLAFWPSKVSDYHLPRLNGSGVDVLRVLKDACDRHGLKLGLYYSQWQDWEHPGGWGNFWDFEPAKALAGHSPEEWERLLYSGRLVRPSLTPDQFAAYWRGKVLPQVSELLTNYQPALLWFDCWVPREETIMTQGQLQELLALVRKLAPDCLVNSRLGMTNVGPGGVDFQSMADNQFPGQGPAHPWETSATLGATWGYNRDDLAWRPTSFFIRELAGNISKGGNLQLNVGPRADGSLPPEAVSRLKEIGRCLSANGAGFYGGGPTPFPRDSQDWGLFTGKTTPDGRHFLYAHVFEWPVDGIIRVNGLRTPVRAVRLHGREPVSYGQFDFSLRVLGPRTEPTPFDTVVELELEGPAAYQPGLAREVNGGGWRLGPEGARVGGQVQAVAAIPREGVPARLEGWAGTNDFARWTLHMPELGRKRLRICYACPLSAAGQEFSVRIGERVWHAKTEGTHSDWREYRTFLLGEVSFTEAGEYEVIVSPVGQTKGGLFRLAWLFVE